MGHKEDVAEWQTTWTLVCMNEEYPDATVFLFFPRWAYKRLGVAWQVPPRVELPYKDSLPKTCAGGDQQEPVTWPTALRLSTRLEGSREQNKLLRKAAFNTCLMVSEGRWSGAFESLGNCHDDNHCFPFIPAQAHTP